MKPQASRYLIAVLLCLPAAADQIPAEDGRNIFIRDPNTSFQMPQYASRADWDLRRAHLQKQILSAAGLLPLPVKAPLRPRFLHRYSGEDFSVETVLLETLPGYFLAGSLYRPLGRSGRRFPAVLSPHGHWKHGRLENLRSYSIPALGVNLARQGYVVFAYDMAGYNDTRQTPHSFSGVGELLWSFNPLGLQLWNSIRSVDFLQSLEDVDPKRIAAAGASGGGTQTFLLSAVDDRIQHAAIVNMVSAHMQGGDPCEEAPSLRLGTVNVEFAAMTAPRPLLLISSTQDWTKNTPEIEFPSIQRIYQLFGKPHYVANAHIDAEHNFNRESREAFYPHLARFVQPQIEKRSFLDQEVETAKDAVFSPLQAKEFPEGALDYGNLFAQWKGAAQRQSEATRDRSALRERLLYSLAVEWPVEVLQAPGVLSRAGRSDRVPVIWKPGSGPPTLIVHPDGATGARTAASVQPILRSGRPVLLIDAFQTGLAKAPRDHGGKYFLSYNRTDDANRVQDILTALRFMTANAKGRPRLVGLGRAGVWCLFAAALAPVDVELIADLDGFSGSDEDFKERFLVPGIQRAGGLPAALRLVRKFRSASFPDSDSLLTE